MLTVQIQRVDRKRGWVWCNTLGIITLLLLYWPGYLWDSLRIFLFELKLNYPQCTFQETEHQRDLFNVSFPENISALSHLSQFEWSVLIAKHETKLLIELLQILCLIILFQTKRVDEAKCLFGSISYDILKWDDFLKAVASISQKKGSKRIRDASDPSSYDVCCCMQCTLPVQDTKHWKTWGGTLWWLHCIINGPMVGKTTNISLVLDFSLDIFCLTGSDLQQIRKWFLVCWTQRNH